MNHSEIHKQLIDYKKIKQIDNHFSLNKQSDFVGNNYLYESIHTKENFIIKHINNSVLKKYFKKNINKDLENLKGLKNPFLTKIINIIKEKNDIFIVYEFNNNSITLYDYLQKKKYLKEEEAVIYIIQLLIAVNYLHDNKILHKYLKSENILIINGSIKLTNYFINNNCNYFEDFEKFYNYDIIAPEVINGEEYSESSEVWSIGVLLFNLLQGYSPFLGKSKEEQLISIKKNKKLKIKNTISKECDIFLNSLLSYNPVNRTKIIDIVNNKFIKHICINILKIDILKYFKSHNETNNIKNPQKLFNKKKKYSEDLINLNISSKISNKKPKYSEDLVNFEISNKIKKKDTNLQLEELNSMLEEVGIEDENLKLLSEFENNISKKKKRKKKNKLDNSLNTINIQKNKIKNLNKLIIINNKDNKNIDYKDFNSVNIIDKISKNQPNNIKNLKNENIKINNNINSININSDSINSYYNSNVLTKKFNFSKQNNNKSIEEYSKNNLKFNNHQDSKNITNNKSFINKKEELVKVNDSYLHIDTKIQETSVLDNEFEYLKSQNNKIQDYLDIIELDESKYNNNFVRESYKRLQNNKTTKGQIKNDTQENFTFDSILNTLFNKLGCAPKKN